MLVVSSMFAAAAKAGLAKIAGHTTSRLAAETASAVAGRQLNDAYEQTIRDIGLSAFNAVRALLAVELKMPPSDECILGLMAEAGQTPAFPARAVRLIEAMRRSSSERRREMLAAVLYGLPFTETSEEDLDRVDMLVERLIPDDIELLGRIAKYDTDVVGGPRSFYVTLHRTGDVKIAGVVLAEKKRTTIGEFVPSGPAFAALEALGCIHRSNGFSEGVTVNNEPGSGVLIEVTPLGKLLLDALRRVHMDPRSFEKTEGTSNTKEQ